MRLGIDYRLLASRENLVNRGIGRYTQQQLRHVLQMDAENEYLLLCPPGADDSLVLPEIRGAANVSLCFAPRSADPPADPYDRRGLLRRAEQFQAWIHGLGVDVYHATAPFVLEQTAPPAFDACPTVATVYDLIPLVFPSAYFTDPPRQAAYAGAARMVTTATRLLAISDGTREDAVRYLGVPRSAIDCAWPFADPCFRPLAENLVARTLQPLAARVGLPDRFVLTVAALHHSKNLELLLAGYGRLSPSFRRSLPLVVACHLNEGSVAHLRAWAASFGVDDHMVITGYVSDDELAALYNRATLVVHPSRYEGFGLPVVEAMQCGAAVITTTAPSLPEVAGGAAALVDPDDPTGLAAAIEGVSRDPDGRDRMGERGMARAAAFTPEALAADTLECYRKALAPAEEVRPRMAVCTTIPDLPPGLARSWQVDVFTDDADGVLSDEVVDRFDVHHVDAFDRCHRQHPFAAVVRTEEDRARLPVPPPGPPPAPGFNRLCEVDDVGDGGVAAWATALSTRALTELGALSPGARVLVLGIHAAEVALALTTQVAQVTFAGPWLAEDAPPMARGMLVDPSLVSTQPYDPARLVVRHACYDRLPFPDGAFDAVLSCFADPAVDEAARVVRPGGIVALSATVRLHGPPGSAGIPIDRLAPRPGLVAVDERRTVVSDSTLTARRALSAVVRPGVPPPGDAPLVVAEGALLGYLHLTLRREGGQAPG
ncbi:MAG: glycosyltransferase [Acidimicrobiales bacterium]